MVHHGHWVSQTNAQEATPGAQYPAHVPQRALDVEVMQHGDHGDQIDVMVYVTGLDGIYCHVFQPCASSRCRVPHGFVGVCPMDVIEVWRQDSREIAAAASDVECVAACFRQLGEYPRVEVVVVAPRMSVVENAHTRGQTTANSALPFSSNTHVHSFADTLVRSRRLLWMGDMVAVRDPDNIGLELYTVSRQFSINDWAGRGW